MGDFVQLDEPQWKNKLLNFFGLLGKTQDIVHAHERILDTMKQEFPTMSWDKEKVQNHMKSIKKFWAAYHDLFKDGLSGFAFDPITSTWLAEPEVWDKLIESNPRAGEWRNKHIYNYDKLCQLFAKDRANGNESETTREIKRTRAHLASNCDSIDFIDEMIENNEATLNAFNATVDETNFDSPNCQSESGGSSKKCKTRCKYIDDNIFKQVVSAVDRATQNLGDVLLQCANQSSSKDSEMLEHLVELGIEDSDELLTAQTLLLENPIKRRVFYSFPPHLRKNMLMKMLQKASD